MNRLSFPASLFSVACQRCGSALRKNAHACPNCGADRDTALGHDRNSLDSALGGSLGSQLASALHSPRRGTLGGPASPSLAGTAHASTAADSALTRFSWWHSALRTRSSIRS